MSDDQVVELIGQVTKAVNKLSQLVDSFTSLIKGSVVTQLQQKAQYEEMVTRYGTVKIDGWRKELGI